MNGTGLLFVLAAAGGWSATSGCSTSVLSAIERDRPPVEIVRYDDLDIAGSAGAMILHERLQQAALRVCEPVRLQVIAHDRALDCVRRAVADAVTNIDEPALARIHCREQGRGVVIWPRGGHPGKRARIPRFETRMRTTCDRKGSS